MVVLTSREELAKALWMAGRVGHDKAEAENLWNRLSDDLYPKLAHLQRADALLASGAVIDAADLADDEALVEQLVRCLPLGAPPRVRVRGVLVALAAALSERSNG